MKRGQITVFIIIAILVLVLATSIFFIKKDSFGLKKENISPLVQPVYLFIQQCIDETSEEAIFYTSERGGYYNLPEKTLDDLTPYYLYEGKNYMPSKETIEQQISLYIDENLNNCINDFNNFPDFKIQQSKIKTTTKINENKVTININYPLSISIENNTHTFEEFNSEVPIRLGVIYNAIYQIMQEQIKDPTTLDPNDLYEVSLEKDINIKMVGFIENSIIFIITDEDSKINNQDFVFIFANKYNPKELDEDAL